MEFMRNIAFFFVAFLMLLSSCSSDDKIVLDENTQTSTQDIKININVAAPSTDDLTRAYVKTAWAEGDVIQIWFGTNVQDFKNDFGANPDLVIKYKSGKWVNDETAALSGRTVKAGVTTMKSVYNGNVKVASVDEFTFSNNTLSATIQNWKFLTKIQVVITGLESSDFTNYTLSCDNFLPCTGFQVNADKIVSTEGSVDDAVNGIPNAHGVAFVFAETSDVTKGTYTFTLEDFVNLTTKKYTVTGKVLQMSETSILGLKINIAKFHEEKTDIFGVGVAEYDGGKVKWVQLWENGPKFAEYNVGATRETEFGNYYTWGGSNSISSTSYANNSTPAYKNTGNEQLSGNDDTATNVWGTNWRMITKSEFDYMVELERGDKIGGTLWNPIYEYHPKNLTITWEVVDGVMGCRFTGKDAYSHNSVFFPAAGSYNSFGVQSGVGKTGFYWSSNPQEGGANQTTPSAQYLQVSGNILLDGSVSGLTHKVQEMARQSAGSVRAVFKE